VAGVRRRLPASKPKTSKPAPKPNDAGCDERVRPSPRARAAETAAPAARHDTVKAERLASVHGGLPLPGSSPLGACCSWAPARLFLRAARDRRYRRKNRSHARLVQAGMRTTFTRSRPQRLAVFAAGRRSPGTNGRSRIRSSSGRSPRLHDLGSPTRPCPRRRTLDPGTYDLGRCTTYQPNIHKLPPLRAGLSTSRPTSTSSGDKAFTFTFQGRELHVRLRPARDGDDRPLHESARAPAARAEAGRSAKPAASARAPRIAAPDASRRRQGTRSRVRDQSAKDNVHVTGRGLNRKTVSRSAASTVQAGPYLPAPGDYRVPQRPRTRILARTKKKNKKQKKTNKKIKKR
jgi:hypothetical protein